MKLICDRAALMEALNLAGGVVVSRTPKPVLTCVKLTAADGVLTLSATDLEAALQVSTNRVEVSEPGTALVPADKFIAIVRESTDATLTVETDGDETIIKGQDAEYKLLGYPVADFPELPAFEGEGDFELQGSELHKIVQQTSFATARENSRYAINGVLFERDGNKIHVVATDGHRLAISRGSCKTKSQAKTASAIVPGKALTLMLRLFDSDDETVRVKIADNQILFSSETALLASNLVEGNFPPYKDVVPKDGDKKATLETDPLISAFRRAQLLTNEESKGVRMSFTSDGLTLTSRAPEMGEAEINVDVPEYSGDPVDIGFNPQYILDALKVVESDKVTMEFKAGNKPGVLRTGNEFMYVVMPVNLQ